MKFVAIGGGEIGLTETSPYNLKEIDEEIFNLTEKAHPTLLFVGFNERANFYFGVLKKNFIPMGVQCTYLKFTELSNTKTLESKFKRADIVYLQGGNTIEYMKKIRLYGLDKYFLQAGERGAVLCGISAGAICLCSYGVSDARKYKSSNEKYTLARGMGLINFVFAPHFSSSKRREDMPRILRNLKETSICSDNCTALIISDDKFKVIKSDKNAKVFKAFVKNRKFFINELENSGEVKNLFSKD